MMGIVTAEDALVRREFRPDGKRNLFPSCTLASRRAASTYKWLVGFRAGAPDRPGKWHYYVVHHAGDAMGAVEEAKDRALRENVDVSFDCMIDEFGAGRVELQALLTDKIGRRQLVRCA